MLAKYTHTPVHDGIYNTIVTVSPLILFFPSISRTVAVIS